MATDATNRVGALVGQVASVTSGGRGIGRAVAFDLAMAGAGVALVARSMDHVKRQLEFRPALPHGKSYFE